MTKAISRNQFKARIVGFLARRVFAYGYRWMQTEDYNTLEWAEWLLKWFECPELKEEDARTHSSYWIEKSIRLIMTNNYAHFTDDSKKPIPIDTPPFFQEVNEAFFEKVKNFTN
jgi:hypothetical protein